MRLSKEMKINNYYTKYLLVYLLSLLNNQHSISKAQHSRPYKKIYLPIGYFNFNERSPSKKKLWLVLMTCFRLVPGTRLQINSGSIQNKTVSL
jgi:hypothetical protein